MFVHKTNKLDDVDNDDFEHWYCWLALAISTAFMRHNVREIYNDNLWPAIWKFAKFLQLLDHDVL